MGMTVYSSQSRGPRRDAADPAALVAWAIQAKRIPAADYTLWVNRVTGPGKQDYVAQLIWV